MRPAWVYGLRDPRDGLVWYVGRSARPRARLSGHTSSRYGNSARARWIRGLLLAGLRPELVLLETCSTEEQAFEAEAMHIEKARTTNPRLTNSERAGTAGPVCRESSDATPIFVHLGAELRDALDARAEAERRTVRAVVEAALTAYLQTPVRP